MNKIIATEFYTLDGLMSDPKNKLGWVTSQFSRDLGSYETNLYETANTLLLGRVTFKMFEGYWPKVEANLTAPQEDMNLAKKINSAHKVVISKSLKKSDWQNTTIMPGMDPESIIRLKHETEKNILVVGSASIVQQLTNFGLIDEYHFLVHPIILGIGKPLFVPSVKSRTLALLGTEQFANGVVFLKYKYVGT